MGPTAGSKCVPASRNTDSGSSSETGTSCKDVDSFLKSLSKSGPCPLCSKYFDGLKKHARSCFKKNRQSEWDPPFNFSDSFFENPSTDPDPLSDYVIDDFVQYRSKWLNDLNEFTAKSESKINILHLNIDFLSVEFLGFFHLLLLISAPRMSSRSFKPPHIIRNRQLK